MRGFPFLSTLLIVAGFAVAWWPLQRSIQIAEASSNRELEPQPSPATPTAVGDRTVGDSDLCELRIYASSPWQSLRVESLGEAIIESSDTATLDTPNLSLPLDPQGFDLWVEATFTDDSERVAVGIEIENSTGDVIQRTLWAEDGAIADSVFFQAQAE
jgi:hypothetical protein